MPNVCELRGGQGCSSRINCSLRSADTKCAGYITYPTTAPLLSVELPPVEVPPTSNPPVTVEVSIPGVTIGLKL